MTYIHWIEQTKNLKAGVDAVHQDLCCIIPIITTLNSGALVETGRKLLVDSC